MINLLNNINFDNSPKIYYLVTLFVMTITILFTLVSVINHKEKPFFLLIFHTLVLGLMRLPVLLYNRELDPDESQNISHALTLKQNPIYWQSVDGTTIGPLDQYILLILPKLDYSSIRIVGFFCLIFALLFFYYTLRNFFGHKIAQLGSLLPLVFFAFNQHAGFVHYSSEHLPITLFSIGLFLLSSIYKNKEKTHGLTYFFLGFLIGLSPFAKLQIIPALAVLGFSTLYLLYLEFQYAKSSKLVFQKTFLLIFGVISFPIIVVILTSYYHVFDDFITFYIQGNLTYSQGKTFAENLNRLIPFMTIVPEFTTLLVLVIGMIISLIFIKKRNLKILSDEKMWLSILLIISNLYAVMKSGNDFTHYQLLLIFPICLLANFILDLLIKTSSSPTVLWIYGGIILSIAVSHFVFKKVYHQQLNVFVTSKNLPQTATSLLIKKYQQPNDKLVVWGWACNIYVETQLPEGTAENHTERCIFQHSQRELYRKRFLKNLVDSKPTFFVDAIGENSVWLQDKSTQRYECWQELKDIITQNYTLLGEADDSRVFIRKDRAIKLGE